MNAISWPGEERLGAVRLGTARHGGARQGQEWMVASGVRLPTAPRSAWRGPEWRVLAGLRLGKARSGMARMGSEWHGTAELGPVGQYLARQGRGDGLSEGSTPSAPRTWAWHG